MKQDEAHEKDKANAGFFNVDKIEVELTNAEKSFFSNKTKDKYICNHCDYEGQLVHNDQMCEIISVPIILGSPLLAAWLFNLSGFMFALVYVFLVIFIVFFLNNELPVYSAKCPNCGIKSKSTLYPSLQNDDTFDDII